MQPITKTPYHSYCTGAISKGCALCVQGRKLVLFITGICPQRCFYCPVSEHKFGHDDVYANEWKIEDPNNPVEMFEEAKLTDAIGAGITGGDPLARVDRCVDYIKALKERYGKEFHIHLYTPLALVNEENLKKLHDAGLDEIRFHPDLDDKKLWDRLFLANEFDWDVGIEIPVIPGKEEQTKELIDYFADKIKFINFNELELSDTDVSHYALHDAFAPKDDRSYGVKGSEEMALQMLEHAKEKGLRAHYCTAKLKDRVQMQSRLQRRAVNIALSVDECTDDGTLLRGCAYAEGLQPGFDYKKRVDAANKEDVIANLYNSCEDLKKELGVDVFVDAKKFRLLLSRDVLEEHADLIKKKHLVPALVEEYPTHDSFELDVLFV